MAKTKSKFLGAIEKKKYEENIFTFETIITFCLKFLKNNSKQEYEFT